MATIQERANLPVSLPVENPTQSFWQDPPDDIATLRCTAELPPTADVVIVGSGITGATVAWGLLGGEDEAKVRKESVVMLEAREACSGATGRNGGYFVFMESCLARELRCPDLLSGEAKNTRFTIA
jgi:hypothetical protein